MARLIGNNIISAPMGMNKDYLDDYVNAAKSKGDIFKGIGEISQGLEDTYEDYLDRKDKREEDEYIRKRNTESDKMAAERFKMEKQRYEDTVNERTKRLNLVEEFKKNADPNLIKSVEWRAAANAFIDGDNDAFLKLYDRRNNDALLKKVADEENAVKEEEEMTSDTEKVVSHQLQQMKLGSLTDKQVKEMNSADRYDNLVKLNNLYKIASDNHLTNLVHTIETQQQRLQQGAEKYNAAEGAKESAARKKQEQERLAAEL